MSSPLDWPGSSGDVRAPLWREVDRALGEIGDTLDAPILNAAPAGPFRALDVGCSAGSTTIGPALAHPNAWIVAADVSPALIEVARARTRDLARVEAEFGHALDMAWQRAPFALILSRPGVMFDDPASDAAAWIWTAQAA
jgi:2-polyprenyl-3-methyl-5-hydroxy-6-metoxy-1,4-benzoquinol methylase